MSIQTSAKIPNTPLGDGRFKHVSYLWDESKAASLAGDEVALLVNRSNL
jgi:hypothetical protein